MHEQEVFAYGHTWPITATNLVKVYNNGLLAVNNNTFGVKQGSTLGLLGPNGAGKSSTFSMLSMEQPISTGDA
jgi:ABC-type multidrug transport system ATPase subunit